MEDDREPPPPQPSRVDQGAAGMTDPGSCPGGSSSLRGQTLVPIAPGVSKWASARASLRAPAASSPFAAVRRDSRAEFDQQDVTAVAAAAGSKSLKPSGAPLIGGHATTPQAFDAGPPSGAGASGSAAPSGSASNGRGWAAGSDQHKAGTPTPLALHPGQERSADDWWTGLACTLPATVRAASSSARVPGEGPSPFDSAGPAAAAPLSATAADATAPAAGGPENSSEESAARLRAQLDGRARLSRFATEDERKVFGQRVLKDVHSTLPSGVTITGPRSLESRRPRGPGIDLDPIVGHRHGTPQGAFFPPPPARTTPLALACAASAGPGNRGSEGAARGSNAIQNSGGRKRQRQSDATEASSGAGGPPSRRRSASAAAAAESSIAAELRMRAARGAGGEDDDEDCARSLLQYAEAQWDEVSKTLTWRKVSEPLPAAFGYAKQAPHALHGLGLRIKKLRPNGDNLPAALHLMGPYLPQGAVVTVAPDRTGPIKLLGGNRRGGKVELQLGSPEESLWWAQAMAIGPQHPIYGWAAALTPEVAAGAACARLLTTVCDNPGAVACGTAPQLNDGLLSCGGMEDEVGAVGASSSEDDTEMEEEGEEEEAESGSGAEVAGGDGIVDEQQGAQDEPMQGDKDRAGGAADNGGADDDDGVIEMVDITRGQAGMA